MSTVITARSRSAKAAASRGIRWAAAAPARIGMKRPDVFGALYAMSWCVCSSIPRVAATRSCALRASARRRPGERGGRAWRAARSGRRFRQRAVGPSGRLGAESRQSAGVLRSALQARRARSAGRGQVVGECAAAHGRSVRAQLEALSGDRARRRQRRPAACGQREPRRGADAPFRVPHEFEEYEGDRGNRVSERFASKVLPFFSEQLDTARR